MSLIDIITYTFNFIQRHNRTAMLIQKAISEIIERKGYVEKVPKREYYIVHLLKKRRGRLGRTLRRISSTPAETVATRGRSDSLLFQCRHARSTLHSQMGSSTEKVIPSRYPRMRELVAVSLHSVRRYLPSGSSSD